MTIYLVYVEPIGVEGIVANVPSAVQKLVDIGFLDACFVVDGTGKTIIEDLGEDYKEIVANFSVEEFNNYFEGAFNLEEFEVFDIT